MNDEGQEDIQDKSSKVLKLETSAMVHRSESNQDLFGEFFRPSPLKISLVIQEIFRYLDWSDLATCRLVCFQWNEVAIPFIQNEKEINISFIKSDFHDVMSDLKRFVQEMGNSPKIPYSQYSLSNLSLRNPTVKKLFQVCGSKIKRLHLGATQKTKLNLPTFSHLLIQSVPNLEALFINKLPDCVMLADQLDLSHLNDQRSTLPLFPNLKKIKFPDSATIIENDKYGKIWKQIFENATNLKKITLETYVGLGSSSNEDFKLLKFLKEAMRLGSITNMTFRYLRIQDFDFLSTGAVSQGMALRKLKVSSIMITGSQAHGPDTAKAEPMTNFLKTQSKSLKTLILGPEHKDKDSRFAGVHFLLCVKMPKMECLKVISSTSWEFGCTLIFENASIDLPKIHNLHIQANDLNSSLRSLQLHPNSSLRSLIMDFEVEDEDIVKSLGSLFPSVECLSIVSPSFQQVSNIWTSFPNLKRLSFNLKHKKAKRIGWDRAFGNFGENFKTLLPKLNDLMENSEEIRKCLYPSICELTHLEVLKITGFFSPIDCKTSISDITGCFLLSNMSSLRTLEIESCRISKQCEDYIRKKIPRLGVLEIMTNNDRSITIDSGSVCGCCQSDSQA